MMSARVGRNERRPTLADLVPGARLRMVNGLHPDAWIEVARLTPTKVQYVYERTRQAGSHSKGQRYSAGIDWIISHTEVVE